MDQAVSLLAQEGRAMHVEFNPVSGMAVALLVALGVTSAVCRLVNITCNQA